MRSKQVRRRSFIGDCSPEEPHIQMKRCFVPVSIPDRPRMRFSVGTVDYFYIETPDKPGEGAKVLAGLRDAPGPPAKGDQIVGFVDPARCHKRPLSTHDPRI